MDSSALAKAKFEKIQKAYETLSNSKQRDLYDLENDYSKQGRWKGFQEKDYRGDSTQRHKHRSPRNKNWNEGQGFWDSNFEENQDFSKKTEEDDIFDEFFFTGKQSAFNQENDRTRGKDLEIDLPLEFMDSIHGWNKQIEITK